MTIDRRKKVLTVDQIIIFLRTPILPHEHIENTQFLAGARAFGGQFDFGSIFEKIKIRWKLKSDLLTNRVSVTKYEGTDCFALSATLDSYRKSLKYFSGIVYNGDS